MTITGTHFNYYFICRRKLWLFAHNIQMEMENENVQIGKVISENTYGREKHEVGIYDELEKIGVKIDFIDTRAGVVNEVKKTDSFEVAHKWQLLYYLYVMKTKGFEITKGKIDYPKQRKITEVTLDEESEKKLLDVINRINEICMKAEPLRVEETGVKKNVCKKCSYYELCFA